MTWLAHSTKAAVAGESIDILSVGQGLLLLHGFDYRPRPIFQGYSAYTPRLAASDGFTLISRMRLNSSVHSASTPSRKL